MNPNQIAIENAAKHAGPCSMSSTACRDVVWTVHGPDVVSAVSTSVGPDARHLMLRAALGCNLAWGLVDAVMFLVRTLANRGQRLRLALAVQRHRSRASRADYPRPLPPAMGTLRRRHRAGSHPRPAGRATALPTRPTLDAADWLGSVRIFFIVVLSTFPVALPFVLIDHAACVARSHACSDDHAVRGWHGARAFTQALAPYALASACWRWVWR